ncbi:CsgG/HfaB family protein [Caldithrix abyssi]|nr:CsgG/HfaB family protein [Caldithrix abyssi]
MILKINIFVLIFCLLYLQINPVFSQNKKYKLKPTIAVLNFYANTGYQEVDAMLSLGTPETIITDLSNIDEIDVIERNRIVDVMKEISLNLSGVIDEYSAQKAGKLLGAQYILIGNWQKFGSLYRVNARLIETETGKIIVGIKETGTEETLFDIQDNISEQILSKLSIDLTDSEKAKLRKRETISINAFKEFSQGLMAYDSGDKAKLKYHMSKALEIDPNYVKPKEYIYVPINERGEEMRWGLGIDNLIGPPQAKSETEMRLKNGIFGAIVCGIVLGGGSALLKKDNSVSATSLIITSSVLGFFIGYSNDVKKKEKNK